MVLVEQTKNPLRQQQHQQRMKAHIKFLIPDNCFCFFLFLFAQCSWCRRKKKNRKKAEYSGVSAINMDMCNVQRAMNANATALFISQWTIISSKCARLIERKGTWYSKQIKCVQKS